MGWSKLLFQIMNFMVMLLILYRLFFKSVLRTLDKRANRVTSSLDDAEERAREATRTCAEYQESLARIQEYIDSLKQETEEELRRTRKRVLAESRHEMEMIRGRARIDMEEARQKAIYEHQCQLGRLVTTLSERMIREVGGGTFQEACIEQFVTRLSALPADEYRYVSPADEEQVVKVQLASAYELDAASIVLIEEHAQEMAGRHVEMVCKIDPALVAGATLCIGDTVIDGSVAGRLRDLYERYVAGLEREGEDKRLRLEI